MQKAFLDFYHISFGSLSSQKKIRKLVSRSIRLLEQTSPRGWMLMNNQHLFVTTLEARSPRSGHWQMWVW